MIGFAPEGRDIYSSTVENESGVPEERNIFACIGEHCAPQELT